MSLTGILFSTAAKSVSWSMFTSNTKAFSKEFLFQVVLHALVFSFYSYEDDIHAQDQAHQIQTHHVIYFLHYALATLVISYVLLPRFFYRKKYGLFFVFALLIVAAVIAVEELVLEKIYFPTSRGIGFPGVFYSLWEVLPVIAILTGAKFAWDALGKQREVDTLKAAVQESELQFLKSQINPHFLFNNLNNLYSYAIVQSPKTPTIILELSAVLRYMLYDCREKFVALNKEIHQLENFTRLSELQIEERGRVSFTADNIQSNYQIAPLILLVFIENAFKHSQAGQSENIRIDIDLQMTEEGRLDFVCRNNHQSGNSTADLSHGIGLPNVQKRLQLLYPGAHQLTIQSTDDQYEVHLSILLQPLATHELHHYRRPTPGPAYPAKVS